MYNLRSCLCVGFLAFAVMADAAPVVNLGQYYVRAGGFAVATLPVTDSGNPLAQDIEGMDFTLQIGAGTQSAPAIDTVDFLTGSVWTGRVPANPLPSPGANQPQFKSFTLFTEPAGNYIDANGRLATVIFQGAGAMPGDYAIKLTGTKSASSDSQFTNGLGATVLATFSAGTLTVVAPGDFDRNGQTNPADVQAMLKALNDLSAYKDSKGLNEQGLLAIGDLNNSGAVTNADIQRLLNILATGNGSGVQPVPEPTSALLATLGLVLLGIVGVRHSRRS